MSKIRNTTARMIHFDHIAMNELRYLKEKWRMNNSEIVRKALAVAFAMEEKGINVENSRTKQEYSDRKEIVEE